MENSSNLRNIITEETTLGELLSFLGEIEKPKEKMTPKKIAESAGEPVAKADGCLVYGNGYAVYDNGSGRTALWIPDCISFTYRFVQPKETEVGIVPAKETLPDGLLESLPWMIAITLVGDHRVENNLMNRTGSRLGTVDFDSADNGDKDGNAEKKVEESYRDEFCWSEGRFGENPEAALIRKETIREIFDSLTEKQKAVFYLYYKEGYSQKMVAEILNIRPQSARDHLECIIKKIKTRKFFPEIPVFLPLPRQYMRGPV